MRDAVLIRTSNDSTFGEQLAEGSKQRIDERDRLSKRNFYGFLRKWGGREEGRQFFRTEIVTRIARYRLSEEHLPTGTVLASSSEKQRQLLIELATILFRSTVESAITKAELDSLVVAIPGSADTTQIKQDIDAFYSEESPDSD